MNDDRATDKQIAYLQDLLLRERINISHPSLLTDVMVAEVIDRIDVGALSRKEASSLIDIFKPGPFGLTNALVLTRMLNDFETLLDGTLAARLSGGVQKQKRYDFFAGTLANSPASAADTLRAHFK